jgi:hypothetical protein
MSGGDLRGAATFSVGPTKDGRTLGIVSLGGHPRKPGSGKCLVVWVDVLDGPEEGPAWEAKMRLERPWETRQ